MAEAELEAAKKEIAALKAENAELQVRVPSPGRWESRSLSRTAPAACSGFSSGFSSVHVLAQALCIQTQAKLNEDAERHEKRDAELKELQELCVQTQANLNEEAARQERRDAELEELKQLCIETQANMNKQLTTPEGQKDAELAELRELCIQTQAKLCEDAGAEESLRAQLAKKEAELAELTQLCIETQKSLNEQAAEEGTPPEGTPAS